jgi:uncharacterized protein YraI
MIRKLLGTAVLVAVASTACAAATTETTDLINLRSAAGVDYGVTAVIPTGALVDVVSCDAQWCLLKWGGQSGYVEGGYLLSYLRVGASALALAHRSPAVASAAAAGRRWAPSLNGCESQWGLPI